ncbi:FIST C domain-containing protein [Natronincola peptidivorans]|uniref:FIST C domain-containing protein n=1 Tax=Natronincola peptidivorans TaxID=426128 RepID=A0A1I0BXV8_9FIRM|nr:FIST C-terminal domain-containing protein [Natronincola peptidivorans]SET11666.1 FIST C domain-containing protein [Natronincola peptidivorans]
MYYSSLEELQSGFTKIEEAKLLLFIGEETSEEEISNLFSFLNQQDVDYMGGIFPGVIYQDTSYEKGFVIKNIYNVVFAQIFPLNSEAVVLPALQNKDISSLVLLDGLSPYINKFLKLLFTNYTDTVKYFGGGTGSIKLEQKPSVFCNGKLCQDSAVVVLFNKEVEIYTEHGWEIMEGPHVITAANENILEEINWRNGLDFYQEVIYDKIGQQLTKDNFFDIIKGFPLGIESEDSFIVRDPLAIVDDKKILCVSDIPNNSNAYILKGDKSSLLESSNKLCIDNRKSNSFLFDCVSRALFLEEDLHTELQNVSNKTPNEVVGALTIGEIASTKKGKLEFLNKTLVYCEID